MMSPDPSGAGAQALAKQRKPDKDATTMHSSACRYAVQVDLSNKGSQPGQMVLLTGRNKKVLEVGPATGYISEALRKRGCRVTAIEKDLAAAEMAARFCERMIVGDVEQLDFAATFPDELFDVVMFGEVLEHLVDPHRALVEAAKVLHPGGHVVASVPNVAHGSVRLLLLAGAFPYRDVGLLDHTHLRFLTRDTLTSLFKQAGYVIRVWRRVTVDPFSSEFNLRERDFPAHLVASLRQDPEAMTYQFVVKASPVPGGATAQWTPSAKPRIRPAGEALKALARFQHEIDRLNAEVTTRDALLSEKDQLLSQRDAQLAEDNRRIADLQTRLSAREAEVREAWDALERVTSTRGYRALERVRSVIRWLSPPGSRRRRAVKRLARGWRADTSPKPRAGGKDRSDRDSA